MRVEWTTQATVTLYEILDYIAADSPSAAITVSRAIREQAGQLAEFPQIGRVGRVRGSRELVVSGTPYVLAYRVEAEAVVIVRILHGAQRWPRKL